MYNDVTLSCVVTVSTESQLWQLKYAVIVYRWDQNDEKQILHTSFENNLKLSCSFNIKVFFVITELL